MSELSKALFVIAIVAMTGCAKPECDSVITHIDEVCKPAEMQVLNSTGGNLYVALEMTRFVLDTHVEGRCLSACTVIASAGEYRTACHDSIYGFHQSNLEVGTVKLKQYYESDQRFDSYLLNHYVDIYPSSDMKYVNAYKAKSLGLVDEIFYCS